MSSLRQATASIILTASKIASGGGQMMRSDTIQLKAVKDGIEKTNIRLTDHGSIKDDVFLIGLKTVGSYGLETVSNFADQAVFRTSNLSGGGY